MFPCFRLKKKKITEGRKDSRASTPRSLAQGSTTELYIDFFQLYIITFKRIQERSKLHLLALRGSKKRDLQSWEREQEGWQMIAQKPSNFTGLAVLLF